LGETSAFYLGIGIALLIIVILAVLVIASVFPSALAFIIGRIAAVIAIGALAIRFNRETHPWDDCEKSADLYSAKALKDATGGIYCFEVIRAHNLMLAKVFNKQGIPDRLFKKSCVTPIRLLSFFPGLRRTLFILMLNVIPLIVQILQVFPKFSGGLKKLRKFANSFF
jgi:hypothetical protein